MKDPPPEGLHVAAHAPTSRVWEPVRELQRGASAGLALFELLAVGRVSRPRIGPRITKTGVRSHRTHFSEKTHDDATTGYVFHKGTYYFFFFRAGLPFKLSGWSAVSVGRIDAGSSE